LTRMPELMQILEDQAEYVIRIEGYKRRRPNSPGSSKRHHFERPNQKPWEPGQGLLSRWTSRRRDRKSIYLDSAGHGATR
jgi:hypothetical protein